MGKKYIEASKFHTSLLPSLPAQCSQVVNQFFGGNESSKFLDAGSLLLSGIEGRDDKFANRNAGNIGFNSLEGFDGIH
jgi:hypothetical protein